MSGPPSAPSPWRALVILLGAIVVAAVAIVGVRAALGLGGASSPTPSPSAPVTSASPSPAPTGPEQLTLLVQLRSDDGLAAMNQLMTTRFEPDGGSTISVPPGLLVNPVGGVQTVFAATALAPTPTTSQRTLSDLLGVRIDATWALDRLAFAGLIDSIGGIYLDVRSPTVVRDEDGAVIATLGPGIQRIDGPVASTWVLTRQPGEDDETAQRRFAEMMRQVLVHLPTEPARVELLLGSLGSLSRTTAPADAMTALLLRLRRNVDLNRVESYALPVKDTTVESEVLQRLDFTAAERLMDRLFAGLRLVPGPSQPVRVLVFNGTSRAGLPGAARPPLESAGDVFLNGGSSDGPVVSRSSVTVALTAPGARQWGADVAVALGLSVASVVSVPASVTTADVVVVLGIDYRPQSDEPPEPAISLPPSSSP